MSGLRGPIKASDLMVRALENEGVEFIFGIPGEENLDLLESLRDSRIRLVVTRHEQGAGFMAATVGRLTGKLGVCLATLGPGATNFVTAAAYAQLGAMPMMMITGQKPIKKSKQARFQIIDVVEMMRPVTKFARQIVHGANIPSTIREAIRLAEEERPGAVHLELPEDIAEEQVAEPFLFDPTPARRPAAEDKAIRQAVEMIEGARHPLLLVGAGANRKRTSKQLTRFVEQTGIPFICTQMGKGVIDERHVQYLGTAALSDNDSVHDAIAAADLVINVGHDVIEKPPFFMSPGGFDVLHISFASAAVDAIYFPQKEVVGDIANAVWQINETIRNQEHWDFSTFKRVQKKVEEHVSEKSDDPSFPLVPQRLVADVRRAMPEDGIVCLDNGMYKIWFARNYEAYQPNTILLDNALATMGAGLPSAIGASFVYPDRKILAVCGDGGFMMNSQELETAVRTKRDVTTLILRDDSYGMIRWKQGDGGFPDWGLEFGNPDFVAYAESYGARGYRVKKADDLLVLLRKCLDEGGVNVIECPVDYAENASLRKR
ncbi:MAG: acetolactate synthase large subunit [Spirochaetaceae bacterium]|nr:acetolactate synthase large subunit [Spirochaetaceae bacterium]HPG27691.1 acetolactate synthase large subunit [Myxococcota bacterium]